jgi:hypothetical protein
MTTQAAHVAARIKQLAAQLNINKPSPDWNDINSTVKNLTVEYPDRITPKQRSHILRLIHKQGKHSFLQARTDLGIDVMLSTMSEKEASLVIKKMLESSEKGPFEV